MSILRYKQKLLPYGNPMGGGPSGGGGPSQSTTYTTNIPEYARPYVENMLQSTQSQIYNEDMTGFRPYQAYGATYAKAGDINPETGETYKGGEQTSYDPNRYFAGFSPLQQSAQQAAYYMQTPGQYGTATGLAEMSGLGSLGLAGQAAGAGRQYAQVATDPRAMQDYMSPYMQNVVDYQKSQALRDYNIGRPMRARQAIGAGAFGGSRQAIAEAEAERSLMSQLQGITATGSQKAFEDAQRQQQFGAQLGLQGLQTGLQGMGQAGQAAGTLGQLGAQQFGAQKDIIGLQSQMGAQQQQLEQQKINQAIQDYAIAQQYPFMQLGMMNAMLRGLPLQTQTTQLYQAQPSMLQQGIGLAGAGLSLGRAAGGAIKEYRQGGIVGYAPGGVIDSTRAQLEQIADMPGGVQKLEQIKNSSTSDEVRKMAAEVIIEKQMEEQAKQQTQQARMSGIAMAGGPAFDSMGMAGGGIIAFANTVPGTDTEMPIKEDEDKFLSFEERLQRAANAPKKPFQYDSLASKLGQLPSKLGQFQATKKKEESPVLTGNTEFDIKRQAEMEEQDVQKELGVDKILAKKDTGKQSAAATEGTSGKAGTAAAKSKEYKDFLAELKEAGPKGQAGAEYEKYLTERLGKSSERLSRDERMAMAKGFLKFASTPAPGGIMQAAAAGLGEYATGVEGARKAQDTMEMEAQKARMELDKARRAEERGDAAGAREAYDKYQDRINRLQASQISAGAAGQTARMDQQAVERVMAENPKMSYLDALQAVRGAGKFESNQVQQDKMLLDAIARQLLMTKKGTPEYNDLLKRQNEIYGRYLTPGGGIGGGQATQTAGAVPKDIQGILSKYQ